MNAKKVPRPAAPKTPQRQEEDVPAPINRRSWYIALLIIGSVLLGASTALALLGTFDAAELKVFQFINHADLPAWAASQIASPVSNAVWGMVGLVLVLLAFPKFRLLAWQYVVAGGATYAVVFALEHLVDRARPVGLALYDPILRASQDGPGFPSGHVAVLAALCLTAWPLVSWPWRIFVVILVSTEAWSRIFLGVHAPLDVVGGLAVGMTAVAIIHLTPAKIRSIFKLGA